MPFDADSRRRRQLRGSFVVNRVMLIVLLHIYIGQEYRVSNGLWERDFFQREWVSCMAVAPRLRGSRGEAHCEPIPVWIGDAAGDQSSWFLASPALLLGRKPIMQIHGGIDASHTKWATKEASGSPDLESEHDLTVIIPAFNEESRLPWTLAELGRFLDASGIDYRVLVADDGSTDSTATLTDALGPRFATISLDRNRGKGAAVRTAMLQASGSVVAFTDADLPYELSALQAGYQQIRSGETEVVFGARDLEQSTHSARRRFSRTVATWFFRKSSNGLSREK